MEANNSNKKKLEEFRVVVSAKWTSGAQLMEGITFLL